MGDLAQDLRLEGADGRFRGVVSPDWLVLTPNGGFLASLALAAAGATSPLQRPASISCHYLRVPAIDTVDLEVASMRRSDRAESLRVSVRQHDRAILEALVWTTAEDQDGLVHDMPTIPSMPAPETMDAWTPREDEPLPDDVLRIWKNLDMRLEGWPADRRWQDRPGGDPLRREWCRFRPTPTFSDPYVDAARSVIVIDTLMFCAALMAHPGPMTHVAPSLDLTVWLHRSAIGDEWLLCESASPVAEQGLVGGGARVWTRDGRLVASGGQQMLCKRVAGDPAVPQATTTVSRS